MPPNFPRDQFFNRGSPEGENEMTASLPASFRVVDQRPETPVEKVRAVLGEAPWLNDPETWDRAKFVEQINQAFFDNQDCLILLEFFSKNINVIV